VVHGGVKTLTVANNSSTNMASSIQHQNICNFSCPEMLLRTVAMGYRHLDVTRTRKLGYRNPLRRLSLRVIPLGTRSQRRRICVDASCQSVSQIIEDR